MTKHPAIRGEKHHWWPKSLSRYWTNDLGQISRVDTEGNVIQSSPTKLGRISNAHNLIFDEASDWNQSFEPLFARADGNFPSVVEWLVQLVERHETYGDDEDSPKCFPHDCDVSDLQLLLECLVSLVARSPKFRFEIEEFVRKLRNTVSDEEIKQLVALNLQQTYQGLLATHSGEGKFLVLVSHDREFIFGDGFYNNVSGASRHPVFSRILLPLTPGVAVLYSCPMQYKPDPPLFTRRASSDVVSIVNETVQVYSRDYLFYRTQEPKLSEHFLARQHLVYASDDPVDELIANIPGVGFGARNLLF